MQIHEEQTAVFPFTLFLAPGRMMALWDGMVDRQSCSFKRRKPSFFTYFDDIEWFCLVDEQMRNRGFT